VISTFDTESILDGRVQIDGQTIEHFGVLVRVRSDDYQEGYVKARDIAVALDLDIEQTTTTIGSTDYLVEAVTRRGGVISLGKESGRSKRDIFTVNTIVTLRQIS